MKKKLLFLSLAAITSLSFVSCGITNTNSSTDKNTDTKLDSRLTKNTNTLYVETNTGVETEVSSYYYIQGEGDIPFVNLNDSLSIMQRSHNDTNIKIQGEVITIGRDNLDSTITFNFQKKTVYYNNLDLFTSRNGKESGLNLVSDLGTLENGTSKYLQSQTSAGLDFYIPSNPITLDLSEHNIPMYFINGGGYIPVQTMSDLVFSFNNIYLLFNGADFFMSGASLGDELIAKYFEGKKGVRSEKMARFSRNELAFILDLIYGLKGNHGITNFNDYFEQTGLDEGLLSTDPLTANTALAKLIYSNFCDYHSSLIFPSYLVGKDARETIVSTKGVYSPNYSQYQLIRYAYSSARKAIYNAITAHDEVVKDKPDCYEEYGDTAFVTFDRFSAPTSDYYTTPATKDATDTFGVCEYAHSQIFRENSPIKNVVLDLSCNSGGAIDAGMYVAGWFLPYGILNIRNTLTGAVGSFTYRSDVNLDGIYDKTDNLSSKHLYCITSPASYSCSNFVANIFKESDQVRLLGRRTSGGSCVVQYLTMADGTFFQTSGNKELVRQHNGSFYTIDQGVDVDVNIDSYSDFFYRPALTKMIDSLY